MFKQHLFFMIRGKVKTIEFYIKPEDKAVYYVINGDFSDKIEL